MDPSSGGSASTTSAPADTSASSTSSAADPSAGLTGMGDPSVAATTPPPATAAAADPPPDPKAGKGKKGKKGDKTTGSGGGGGLTKTECQQISDKGVDLMLAGMGGLDPSMAAQIKAQAAGDPNMAGMMTECMKSTTRAQYKCGMAAASKDEWQTCLK